MTIWHRGFYQAVACWLVHLVKNQNGEAVNKNLTDRMKLLHQIADTPEDTIPLLKGWKVEPREFTAIDSVAAEFTETTVLHGRTEPGGFQRWTFDAEILDVPANFSKSLASAKEVVLNINSPGGSAPAALCIYRALKRWGGPVEVNIEGKAFSAAADLAMAGAVRRMHRDAVMVLHLPSSIIHGDSEALRREADKLDRLQDEFTAIYVAATGQPEAIVREWFRPGSDARFTAEQALQVGLIHSVTT